MTGKAIVIFAIAFMAMACGKEVPDNQNMSDNNAKLFRAISPDKSGIHFNNTVEERFENIFEYFMYVYNGGGVATGDVNNDGLVDLFFTGNEVPNKLYLNKGNLEFEDITERAGVAGDHNWDNGTSMVDINGDGLMDIYVCRGGWQDTPEDRQNQLYINQGDLTFRDEAKKYGLADPGYSMQAVFFDFDNDMDLDVYLINRPDSFALPLSKTAIRRNDPPEYCRDKFFVNYDGVFKEEGKQRGLGENYGYGLSVVTADVNQDGFSDIFVSNDFSVEDYFYLNQGDGTFKQAIKSSFNHISLYSMGTDISDINNDGLEDIVVMEMRPEDYIRSKVSMPPMSTQSFYDIINQGMHKQYMHNMLFLNQGNAYFSEISQYANIPKTDWSWSVLSADLDLDGHKDLFVTNGMRRDLFDADVESRLRKFAEENRGKFKTAEEVRVKGFQGIINAYKPVKIRNYLFQNSGDLKYQDVSESWGFDMESFSNGAAVADLDNDGDLDLIVNNLEDKAFLYENTSDEQSNYLVISLEGPGTNRNGIGAKVEVFHNGKYQYQQNKTVRGYLSSSDPRIHFGLGQDDRLDSIKVTWPDGKKSIVQRTQANQNVVIQYINADIPVPKQVATPILADASDNILSKPFVHQENEFDEYRKQILLPHSFSKNGPSMAVADINGDGLEDCYIGGAAGQAGQFYVQRNGKLWPKRYYVFSEDRDHEDMGSLFTDIDGDGDLDLVVTSGGGQYPEGHELLRDRIYFNDGGNFGRRQFLPSASNASAVVADDVDLDGDMDLFIAGQIVSDQYLQSPASYLLTNENNEFVDKTDDLAQQFRYAGMLNSLSLADLDGDDKNELIAVGEWTSIQIYTWRNGTLTEVSTEYGLSKTEGWWQKVMADDLDNDGDIDLIVGNQGENYKFHPSEKKPFEVFAGDFDGSGTNDIFLAKHNKAKLVPIRGRQCTSDQMPIIGQKFPTFASFAYADVSQIIGSGIDNALHKEAYTFSSIILENHEGQLIPRKLPAEAQFSTLLGAVVTDVNQDGQKDLLIAGNKFDVEVETTAADASPGYVLLGDGQLGFKTMQPHESGLMIPFNVKDLQTIQIGQKSYYLVAINDEQMRVIGRRQ